MLQTTIKQGKEEREWDWQANMQGCGGETVISREAVIVSIRQNRKHKETALFYNHSDSVHGSVHTCPILSPSYPLDQVPVCS